MTSGVNLTIDEKRLLQQHIEFYWSLDSGARVPKTDDQRHFVAVCRGKLRPRTPHEEAYKRLRALVAAHHFDACQWVHDGFHDPERIRTSVETKVPPRPCKKCGSPIPTERIEIVPDADMCVGCKTDKEQIRPTLMTELKCPRCAEKGVQSVMVWRTARDHSRSGYFLGCSSFPECRYIAETDEPDAS